MKLPAEATSALAAAVLDEVELAVVGKRDALTLILLGILARGHVLIEDLPGVGKTLIARSFAAVLGPKVSIAASASDVDAYTTRTLRLFHRPP